MTEYALERERRRKQRSLLLGAFTLAITAALTAKNGPFVILWVLTGAVAVYAAILAFFWRARSVERQRRVAGALPSWAAQLPVRSARELGASGPGLGRHSAARDVGELLGRLVYFGGGLRWEPSRSLEKRGVGSVTWDRSWSIEVVSLWGPGRQGCLTLTRPDGFAVDLWIRDPKDLRRTLGLPGPQN